jgi:hypothetical protein
VGGEDETGGVGGGVGARVFVSYAGPDRQWAEWVAWCLTDAGYVVELDVWDWAAGDNFVVRMNNALARAQRVVALLSPAYFEPSRFTTDEWTAAFAERPDVSDRRRLVPLRVTEVTPPPVLGPVIFKDLFGLDEAAAQRVLLAALAGPSPPAARPSFPGPPVAAADDGGERPRWPGRLPAVWNAPARAAVFTGRDAMLTGLRDRLRADGLVPVCALHGLGGVGKTTLAVEYAHRFAADFDLVWWVDAEQPDLVAGQVAGLAVAAGLVAADAATPAAVQAAHRYLRTRGGWLVVFDNAGQPIDLRDWLPQGPGQVLVTSRSSGWAQVGEPVGVDVFARAESIALLRRLRPALDESQADGLAEALGDLPLALAQAGALLDATGMSIDVYLAALAGQAARVLDTGQPVGYPRSLAAAVRLAADHLAQAAPAAGDLLGLCAHLAPEPIPLRLFTNAPTGALPDPLAVTAGDPFTLSQTAGFLARYGLARLDDDNLQLHRLTQAILRDLGGPPARTEALHRLWTLLATVQPADANDPTWWPHWAALLPHIIAVDPDISDNPAFRTTACLAVWYLLNRADTHTALTLAQQLHAGWRHHSGPDDYHVLGAASRVSRAHRDLGLYAQARDLDQDLLDRHRRQYGNDHPATLTTANNLALDLHVLGEVAAARALNEDVLARMRRVLGDDHPVTLMTASNLAHGLRTLGEVGAARALNEDTLARRRRILGDDHPDTLASAGNLALNLSALGAVAAARALNEDVLARMRRVLGDDHPTTLITAGDLAVELFALGEVGAARALNEDVLARRRRILGDDHPNTLITAGNLALNLSALGAVAAARALNEDVLARMRRILGDDHPDTQLIRRRLG